MRYIEGELAQPDPSATWSCLLCRRVEVDEQGTSTARLCGGDPLTGAGHRLTSMLRSPSVAPAGPVVDAPLDVAMAVAEHQIEKWRPTLDWLAER